jgi:hypothetical protein
MESLQRYYEHCKQKKETKQLTLIIADLRNFI